jgi:hypothetical protein
VGGWAPLAEEFPIPVGDEVVDDLVVVAVPTVVRDTTVDVVLSSWKHQPSKAPGSVLGCVRLETPGAPRSRCPSPARTRCRCAGNTVVDLGALAANSRSLTTRAAGKPIRLATKSVRCRAISDVVLGLKGFAGVLALTLPEALWLAETCDDVVVGYPTAKRRALARLAADEKLARRVTLMVDSVD